MRRAIFVLAVLALAVPCLAQDASTGSIHGTVFDPAIRRIAGANESVTVSAEPKTVGTEPRGLSSVIDERAILNLPLNGRRFTDLALLTPGVTQDPRGSNSTSNGDLSFGGIRGFQTSYLVDGADNNNAFFSQA